MSVEGWSEDYVSLVDVTRQTGTPACEEDSHKAAGCTMLDRLQPFTGGVIEDFSFNFTSLRGNVRLRPILLRPSST